MLVLIVNTELAEKLRNIEFPGGNRLDPVPGQINGTDITWLPADIMESEIFKSAWEDLQACELVEIERIEQKFFNDEGEEVIVEEGSDVNILELVSKTILIHG